MKLDTKLKKKIKKNNFSGNKKKLKKIIWGNALFFLPKTRNWENRKIEILGYFCAFYVYTQIFL